MPYVAIFIHKTTEVQMQESSHGHNLVYGGDGSFQIKWYKTSL